MFAFPRKTSLKIIYFGAAGSQQQPVHLAEFNPFKNFLGGVLGGKVNNICNIHYTYIQPIGEHFILTFQNITGDSPRE